MDRKIDRQTASQTDRRQTDKSHFNLKLTKSQIFALFVCFKIAICSNYKLSCSSEILHKHIHIYIYEQNVLFYRHLHKFQILLKDIVGVNLSLSLEVGGLDLDMLRIYIFSLYRVIIKYCVFFRKFANCSPPVLGCYWLHKKLSANGSDCTLALC